MSRCAFLQEPLGPPWRAGIATKCPTSRRTYPSGRGRYHSAVAVQTTRRTQLPRQLHAPIFRKGRCGALFDAAPTVPAQAATPLGDYFTIGGFGTLGGAVTNTNDSQYGHDRQTGGANKQLALDVGSDVGVQLDAKATSWLSGTVQALSAKREDRSFTTRIEWAYVLVKPLDGLSIRGGRMATPTFLISDSRNIGYANNWVRAPNEVYGLNVFHNFEGGDISYRRSFGPVSLNATAIAGKTTFRTLGCDATGSDLRGLNLEVETEWATFRAGRVNAKVGIANNGVSGDAYSFTGYGLSFDRNNIVAQAEFVQRRSGGQPDGTNANGWYEMAGYRLDTFLPYAIVSRTAPLNANSPVPPLGTQRTTALGLRWDAFKSADLKFQVDRVNTSNTAGISFTAPYGKPVFPGAPASRLPVTGNVLVFSVAMDFTFQGSTP